MPILAADTMNSYPYSHQQDQVAFDFTDMPLYEIPTADGTISSPTSPTFPSFSATYQLPQNSDWFPWHHPAKVEAVSPEFPSTESFDSAYPTRYAMSMSGSPVVNPLDLAKHTPDLAFSHGGDELHGAPLFDTAAPRDEGRGAVSKARRTNASARRSQGSEPLSPSSDEPRYPSRKRKSLASAATDSAVSSPRSSLAASPPPAPAPAPSRRSSNLRQQSPATGTGPGPKKTAHNMIEKRYRNNLNDKISALRDAVPSLRQAAARLEGGPVEEGTEADDEFAEEMGGLPPVQKLNKATILSKAAEYIVFLERKNKALQEENAEFRRKAEAEKETGFGGDLWS